MQSLTDGEPLICVLREANIKMGDFVTSICVPLNLPLAEVRKDGSK
jgi:hypothetical protein